MNLALIMPPPELSQLPELPPANSSLTAWQDYVSANATARGWDKASDLEIFLLFSEEVGELAKALRRQRNLFHETSSSSEKDPSSHQLGEEMADVLSYLLDLAQRFGVDLEEAMLDKERRNRTRTWD